MVGSALAGRAIAVLLGKPPERSPVVPDVLASLRDAGATVTVAVPRRDDDPTALPGVAGADLVVLRGVAAPVLRAAVALEEAGVRCCNRPSAALGVLDRAATAARLAAAGVPVPPGRTAARWGDVVSVARGRPVVIKAADGTAGRGAGVLVAADGRLPSDAPFPGPYLVQDHVGGDGTDRKLYVLGDHLGALAKPWPRDPADPVGHVIAPDATSAAIARRAAAATGLDVCGVDVVAGRDGPAVVDVNAFPSARGVPGAAAAVVAHLTRLATGG